MVKNWYTSTTSIPREFCLKNVDEGPNKYKRFSSAQHGTASQRPKLTVNYVDPPVVEYVTISNDPNTWTSDYIITSMKVTQPAGALLSEIQWATSTDANQPADSAFTALWNGVPTPTQSTTKTNTELGLPDGQRYLWVRGKNTVGGIGAAVRSNVMYKRDLSAPTVPEYSHGNALLHAFGHWQGEYHHKLERRHRCGQRHRPIYSGFAERSGADLDLCPAWDGAFLYLYRSCGLLFLSICSNGL